jgi:tRNA (guanine-N7-)-methyltransferase
VGCGYGGLLFALSQRFSSKLIFGLEIRDKLVNYAAEKIRAYKTLYPGEYQNISVVRANSMKHLCHYLFPGTV